MIRKAFAAPPPEVPDRAGPYVAFDHLATMVAIVSDAGQCVFANASFESVLGLSRRSVQRGSLFEWFVDAQRLRDTVAAVSRNGVLGDPSGASAEEGERLLARMVAKALDEAPR